MSIVTREQISKVQGMIHNASQELIECQNTLESLRKICDHKMNYIGHGLNGSTYKCDICGKEEER